MPPTAPEPVQVESAPEQQRIVPTLFRRGARTIGLMLLAFVSWIFVRALADPYGYLSVDPAVMFAVGLVAAGLLLLRGQQPAYDEAEHTTPLEKERSPLGVLTLSVAFLVVGVLMLVGNLGMAEVTIGHLTAAALIVVALGLLVGAWWGRSKLLMVVGVVLVPFVIAGGFMHFPLRGSIGESWYSSPDFDDIDDEFEVLLGGLHMNFADLEDFSGEREMDISIAAGNATIFVPKSVALTVTGHIELGNAVIGHGRQEGSDLALSNDLPGEPGAGHLTINFSGGIASLYIERISYRELHGPLPTRRPTEGSRAKNRELERGRQSDDDRRQRDDDRRPKRAKT